VKPDINKMTLREKIGQTAIPAPPTLSSGMKEYGGYAEYLKKYPYAGIFVEYFYNENGDRISDSSEFTALVSELQTQADIPFFVACDAEFGVKGEIFADGHIIPPEIGVAAANDDDLAYKRGYYWGREMRSMGMNWVYGPVGDLSASFFSTHAPRSFSDDPEKTSRMIYYTVKGLQDSGIAATAKHIPGHGHDFRDSHFSFCAINDTLEEWNNGQKKVWKAAESAGVKTFMSGHLPMPCVDPTPTRGRVLRPGSASKKVLDIFRKDIGHDGIIVSDAVSMKSLAASFDHDDIYIECFNAGNDVILFCHDDYFDVMERAVADGRVTLERLDEAVGRVLRLKEELGLFDGSFIGAPLSADEVKGFEKNNLELSAKALTLVCNDNGLIPIDKRSAKKVSVIAITEYQPFVGYLDELKRSFSEYGVECDIYDGLKSKAMLQKLSDESDLVVYACYINQQRPFGFPGFSSDKALGTLFNAFSYGYEKSVAISFGASSVFYNYFEYANAYIDAYSDSPETMKAVAMALLGDIPFCGTPPMEQKPRWI